MPKIYVVNAYNREQHKEGPFLVHLDAFGLTRFLSFAPDPGEALDEAVDAAVELGFTGLLCDEYVREEYERLVSEGMSENEAIAEAETDLTQAGNCGNYVSYDWGYQIGDRANLKRLESEGFEFEPVDA